MSVDLPVPAFPVTKTTGRPVSMTCIMWTYSGVTTIPSSGSRGGCAASFGAGAVDRRLSSATLTVRTPKTLLTASIRDIASGLARFGAGKAELAFHDWRNDVTDGSSDSPLGGGAVLNSVGKPRPDHIVHFDEPPTEP